MTVPSSRRHSLLPTPASLGGLSQHLAALRTRGGPHSRSAAQRITGACGAAVRSSAVGADLAPISRRPRRSRASHHQVSQTDYQYVSASVEPFFDSQAAAPPEPLITPMVTAPPGPPSWFETVPALGGGGLPGTARATGPPMSATHVCHPGSPRVAPPPVCPRWWQAAPQIPSPASLRAPWRMHGGSAHPAVQPVPSRSGGHRRRHAARLRVPSRGGASTLSPGGSRPCSPHAE